jgi:ELWxxDGT repeat protein
VTTEKDDLLRSKPFGRNHPAQTDGAIADDRRGLAGTDIGGKGGMVARSHHVGESDEGRHQRIARADRENDERPVGLGNAYGFALAAVDAVARPPAPVQTRGVQPVPEGRRVGRRAGRMAGRGEVEIPALSDLSAGEEVWTSDGTAAGTFILKDINPGLGSGFGIGTPTALTNLGGILLFRALSSPARRTSCGGATARRKAPSARPDAPRSRARRSASAIPEPGARAGSASWWWPRSPGTSNRSSAIRP